MLLFVISFAYLWNYEGDSLLKGFSEGTIITRDSVFLGNKVEEFSWESSGFISDIIRIDKDTYFSISDVGIIARMQDDGTIDTVFRSEGSLISLGRKETALLAGLSPDGKILFIKNSKIIDSLSVPADNIYCSFKFAGNFLIGTGPEGIVYKLTDDKKFEEYYKTEAASVTQWVVKGNSLFLGTSNPGLVYKIDANHEGKIYYDPGFEEINGLGFSGDTLCISGLMSGQGESVGVIKFYLKNREYEVFKGTPILCGEAANGKFYAGESEDGQIGEFYRSDFSIVADLDESRVTALQGINDNIWIGTGYPAKIYKFTGKKLKKGEYLSSVFKGGVSVIWGNLDYEGKGDIKFFIRGGKKEEIDSSWIRWKSIDKHIEIEEPFMQWKAVLSGDKAYLKGVRISYGEQNSPPEIKKIGVLPPKIGTGSQMNEGSAMMGAIPPEERGRLSRMGFYIPGDAYIIGEGMRCIYWEASDPDNDRLVFDVFISRDSKSWDKMKEGLVGNSYFLNTSAYPDGTYYARIIARDEMDRSDPLESEKRVSFLVDHTPPIAKGIGKKTIGDSVLVSGTVKDELSSIISVLYSTAEMQKLHWKRARAADELFDEKEEKFIFKVDKKEKYGAIRIVDRSNNSKVVRIEF
jgi:hypothetical protein